MEKNRIRPITNGKGFRMSYSRRKEVLEMPNLIEVQKDSYQWFLDEGLKEVFDDISPIEDYAGKLSLEFYFVRFLLSIKIRFHVPCGILRVRQGPAPTPDESIFRSTDGAA